MREPADEAPAALLGALCRHTVELLGASPAPLQHLRMYIGDIGVELGWPADMAAETGPQETPTVFIQSRAQPRPGEAEPLDSAHQSVCAPTVGAFYRRPEPGAEPFVDLNDIVEAGEQLGILEAMKLMNPILADVSCRIVAILAEDGMSVEHGQPLFAIEPC